MAFTLPASQRDMHSRTFTFTRCISILWSPRVPTGYDVQIPVWLRGESIIIVPDVLEAGRRHYDGPTKTRTEKMRGALSGRE